MFVSNDAAYSRQRGDDMHPAVLFKVVPPENNPLLEPIKTLEPAKVVQSQVMQQLEQQKRPIEAADK